MQLNEYHFPLTVRYGETGFNGVATLPALANWLQEAAGQSANELGFGEPFMTPLHLGWILSRLALRILRLPRAGEELLVKTWPSTLDHLGHRGYEVYDEEDRLIVSGSSAWAIMDFRTRHMGRVPTELAAVYPKDPRPCLPFCARTLPRLQESDAMCRDMLRVRRDDLDINGHVNNARYLAWLTEALPVVQDADMVPAFLDISYRAETFPADELDSLCAVAEDSNMLRQAAAQYQELFSDAAPVQQGIVHSIKRRDGAEGTEVCRALSLWRHPLL